MKHSLAELHLIAQSYGMQVRKHALMSGAAVSPRSHDISFSELPRESQQKWFDIGLTIMQALQTRELAYTRYDLTPLPNMQLEEDLPQ